MTRVRQQQLYTAYELMDQATGNVEKPTVQSQRVEEWAKHIQATLDGLADVRAEYIVIDIDRGSCK